MIKIERVCALTGMALLLGHHLMKRKVTGSIPNRGT